VIGLSEMAVLWLFDAGCPNFMPATKLLDILDASAIHALDNGS
jgi:hypothetical protein